ncbi:hypothetical protein B0H16DRAFT_1780661 [Mycena metata]|uniref:DUF6534 domain-containing protein n=1 Tax=Mycena metata TaxID=1033252 RepID=A0AAD7HQV1_9AGAR|nr:hypothetical protein B0H16DRAFT_1780661 [Mycena metata]
MLSLPAESPSTPIPWLMFEFQGLPMGADLFLQGVLCAQFAHYTNVNHQDSVWMKLFVVGLALLTTLKTLQVLAMISTQNIILFESPGATQNMGSMEGLEQTNLILEAGVAFYVQLFFCHRLWALSHNVYIMVVVISLFIFAVITAIVAAYLSAHPPIGTLTGTVPDNQGLIMASTHLGLAMGGDLLQTGSIVFYLLRHSHAVLRCGPVASMLSSLLRLTVQSAAPGAFCVLVNFAANISVIRSPPTPGSTLVFEIAIIANIMLPKLYAIAAMWTLNYRDEIRPAATHLDLPLFLGIDVGDTTTPEIPKLHAGGTETSSAHSINAPVTREHPVKSCGMDGGEAQ